MNSPKDNTNIKHNLQSPPLLEMSVDASLIRTNLEYLINNNPLEALRQIEALRNIAHEAQVALGRKLMGQNVSFSTAPEQINRPEVKEGYRPSSHAISLMQDVVIIEAIEKSQRPLTVQELLVILSTQYGLMAFNKRAILTTKLNRLKEKKLLDWNSETKIIYIRTLPPASGYAKKIREEMLSPQDLEYFLKLTA